MKKLIPFILAMAFVAPSSAEDTLTLESVLSAAKQNNPEIKAYQKTYSASKEGVLSMSSWSDPRLGYEYMKDNNRLYLAQELSFPGKLSFRRGAAANMAEAVTQEMKMKSLEVETRVKKAFWGYWLAQNNLQTFNENIRLMKRFLEAAKSRYITGKVTEADVLAADTELGRMEGMLAMGEYEVDSMKAELNALMNKGPDEALGAPVKPSADAPVIDYTLLEKKALQGNFGIAAKKYMYESSRSDSKLSKMEWFPDIMAEAWLGDTSDKNTIMASIQVPLYFWGKASEARSKRLKAEAARETVEAEKNAMRATLKDMYLRYGRNIKLMKIYESKILPSAEQAVEIAESGYRAGKVDFQYLLDLEKKYLEYKTEYNKLTAEGMMYLAELEFITNESIK